MTEQSPPPDYEKSICFRFPRYEKRSLFTESAAVILPSAVYGYMLLPLNIPGAFTEIITFFARPLAVIFNSYTTWGYSNSLYLSLLIQLGIVLFLHLYKKITPRYALALSVTLGMLDLLGLKLLNM